MLWVCAKGVVRRAWHSGWSSAGWWATVVAFKPDDSTVRAAPERLKVGFSGLLDDASFRTKSATRFAADLLYYPWSAIPLSLGMRLESIKVPRGEELTAYRRGQPSGTLAQPEHVRHAATLLVRYLFLG